MDSSSRGTGRAALVPLVFAGWTLFVWSGRLRNLAQEPGPIGDTSRWSLIGSIAFVALGLALIAALAAGRLRPGAVPLRPVVGALGALTTGIWIIRAADIAIGDHSVGFIVVHLVLAAVSIGLAAAAWWALPPSPPVSTAQMLREAATSGCGNGRERSTAGYHRIDG